VCYRDTRGIPRAQRFVVFEVGAADGPFLTFRLLGMAEITTFYKSLVEGFPHLPNE
jgi:hypothetical protein